jgi:hypothetical protein
MYNIRTSKANNVGRKLVLWERKIAYQQALEIKSVQSAKIATQDALKEAQSRIPRSEIGKRVVKSGVFGESKSLTDRAMAANLGIETEELFKARGFEGKETGRKRKGKGMWGWEKKQLPKNSTWFTV